MYVEGKILKKDSLAVAIVGTRLPSARAKKLAYDFAFYLAGKGITIVSGLARGVDTLAHRGALDACGRTIAVMGTGLDVIYPLENKDLAKEIVKNGALVTEFSEGTKINPENFLQRNRVIAKLSKAVLVIEGARRSGTLSTASWAAGLGIEVFVVAGSPATDWLITQGVSIANAPADILEYLNTIKEK